MLQHIASATRRANKRIAHFLRELRLGKPGTALFATRGLLGAEFVALYAAFMAYGPASAFASLQTVTQLSC
jgi:hypothetical protein